MDAGLEADPSSPAWLSVGEWEVVETAHRELAYPGTNAMPASSVIV
jgi:hypothetical protein